MNKKILMLGNGFIASEFSRSYSPYLYNFDPDSLVKASDSSPPEYIDSLIQVPLLSSTDDKVAQHFDKIPVNYDSINELINRYQPNVIINCIGKTGKPNVDWCETHQDETVEANLTFPTLLAQICSKKFIHLVHIGSGCINYGASPSSIGCMYEPGWKETDYSNPKSFYSKVKYAADLALSGYDNVTVFRIRMPISPMPNPRNLITKLLGYKKIIQEPNSMTFTVDVLRACKWSIDNNRFGIYNLAHKKPLTAYNIVKEYAKHNPGHQFESLSLSGLGSLTTATRSNCILDCSKIENEGFIFSDINLESCMRQYVSNEKVQRGNS